ncbi:MAG: type II toxin-antitoxin system VapC family toxin [Microlunatus sp.]|nr:type II toxin-antitoxin system VapC family toxin [Microlunatus sp.]MDN5770351.1 type II toxin-antitoxin system VapC family toxin [Microlunatus sp.]MDN5804193.1 type II toxin-antitoxin system VapC family toxin [Microlunatus sp.]
MTVVVDTSALLAVLLGESDAARFADALVVNAGDLHVGAVTLVEASVVLEARAGAAATADLQELLARLSVHVHAVTQTQADLAIQAWRRFGKGRHPARLNLGDTFSYALAKELAGRLLFKGHDFAQTDVAAVLRVVR